MRAWQTLPATWWAGLTWKDTAPTLSAQSVKLFNARTVRWCYGGPEAIGKDVGHPRDKNMALDAFWPEPETITLKMLWALKGCSICEIEIKTETNKQKILLAWHWGKRTVNLDVSTLLQEWKYNKYIFIQKCERISYSQVFPERNMKRCTWARRKLILNIWRRMWEASMNKEIGLKKS